MFYISLIGLGCVVVGILGFIGLIIYGIILDNKFHKGGKDNVD